MSLQGAGCIDASNDEATSVAAAARALAQGGLVVLPTETVYGLAADAGNEAAVATIYAIKGRPPGHPLIVHVSGVDAARWWGELGPVGERLAAAFWPGPLTMIVRRRPDAPAYACGGHPTIGLRVPSHPLAQAVLQAFEADGGHGVAAPSANRFGRISPTRANHVRDDLGSAMPLLLDGGAAVVGIESTIVDLTGSVVQVLRPGAIGTVALEAVVGSSVMVSTLTRSSTAAPGTLAAHYAPRSEMHLVASDGIAVRISQWHREGHRVGCYSLHAPHVAANACSTGASHRNGKTADDHGARNSPVLHWLAMPADAQALTHSLYDDLRRLDAMNIDRLIVEQPASGPLFAAVLDRLQRAETGSGAADR